MVQKLLDELVRDGTLNMQEYGKAKIYYANQVRCSQSRSSPHSPVVVLLPLLERIASSLLLL